LIISYKYHAISELYPVPYVDEHRAFGFLVDAYYSDGSAREYMIMHDVTTDVQFILNLADLFNSRKLHPLHLKDVVEDMLP
jgi:hypothetical protein